MSRWKSQHKNGLRTVDIDIDEFTKEGIISVWRLNQWYSYSRRIYKISPIGASAKRLLRVIDKYGKHEPTWFEKRAELSYYFKGECGAPEAEQLEVSL